MDKQSLVGRSGCEGTQPREGVGVVDVVEDGGVIDGDPGSAGGDLWLSQELAWTRGGLELAQRDAQISRPDDRVATSLPCRGLPDAAWIGMKGVPERVEGALAKVWPIDAEHETSSPCRFRSSERALQRTQGSTAPIQIRHALRAEPRVDEAVGGGSLRVGGTVHARGLGVHAPSRLAFDLEPGGLLRGAVGIDDSVLDLPAEGSVVFRLHWNGAAVWESATLSSGDAPVGLPALDLSAGGRLELEADPTDDSIPGDRANWLDLRVVRP